MCVGFYFMTDSAREYDLDKSAKEHEARVARLESGDAEPKGLFNNLKAKFDAKFETARNIYLGEHFPPVPEGWKLVKTHHGELVDFTVDYKLSQQLHDGAGMRRMMGGLGGMSGAPRATDLAYRKGDKVIFMRLVFANSPIKEPMGNHVNWLFSGSYTEGEPLLIAGATFETRKYEGLDLVNIAAETGHYTGIGVLSNASLAEVERLIESMDLHTFASQTGNPKGGPVVPYLKKTQGLNTMAALEVSEDEGSEVVKRAPKPSPSGNLLDGVAADEDEVVEEPAAKPKKKRKNLLSSLLGGGDEEPKAKKKSKTAQSGSTFQKVGSFSSNCQSGTGAKICRVGGE